MDQDIRKIARAALGAAGYVVGYYIGKALATGNRVIVELLKKVDDALDVEFDHLFLEQQGDQPEPCVCGSTDHESARLVSVHTGAILHNGSYGPQPMTADFTYYETDPLAVAMTLSMPVEMPDGTVAYDSETWGYARDILDSALSHTDARMVGQGSVTAQYWPEQDCLAIWLRDVNEVQHRVDVDAEAVRMFLQNSYSIVGQGSETHDVDAAIEHLLSGTWEQ